MSTATQTAPVTSKGAETTVTRRRREAPYADKAGTPAPKPVSPVAPRGTTRAERQDANEKAKAVSKAEAQIMPPPKEEKAKQIAQRKAEDLAKFGTSKASRRQALQKANAERADREAAEYAAAPATKAPVLTPGEQASPHLARQMAKMHDREERDEIEQSAKAAGIAVRNTLTGRLDRNRHTRQRRIEVANRGVKVTQ